LIDEQQGATVFVRYRRDAQEEEGIAGIDGLLRRLQQQGPQRGLMRKLQRYGVTIYQHDLQRLIGKGDVEPLGADFPGLYTQSSNNDLLYDGVLGINVDGVPGDPASLVT